MDNKKPRNDNSRGSIPNLTFPCPMGKVHALLDQWLQDDNIKLPWVQCFPNASEKSDPKFCRYHRVIGHPTKECWTLKKIYNDRIHSGELVIENKDVRNHSLHITASMVQRMFFLIILGWKKKWCHRLRHKKRRG